jgi:hypothetical protein
MAFIRAAGLSPAINARAPFQACAPIDTARAFLDPAHRLVLPKGAT